MGEPALVGQPHQHPEHDQDDGGDRDGDVAEPVGQGQPQRGRQERQISPNDDNTVKSVPPVPGRE